VELQGYLSILRARRAVVITVTVISLLLALLYSLAVTPTYVARSSVFLSANMGSSSAELSRSFPYAQGLVRSYSQVATEPVVLDPVIKRLRLDTTPGRLAKAITAQAPLDTVIIDIEVADPSAELAAEIANALAAQLSSTVNSLVPGATESTLPVTVTTLTQAEVPAFPSSPKKTLNLALALLIGLLLGSVLAISRDALDVRVRTAQDATTLTRVPVIGSVIAQGSGRRKFRWPSLRRRRHRGARELDNQLRTNFQHMRGQRALKSVVFASALADNATGLTVSNLAIALGEAGLTALMVDADVRRPTLAARHGVSDDTGLTSVLLEDVAARSVIRRSRTSPVWVLPAGPQLRDPSMMMNDAAMKQLLAQLVQLFDVVLIKAPPVLMVADGLMLSRISDGVVVVADEQAMNRDVLGEEMRALDIAGADVLGFVLTQGS
jgi:tyrosine-protein kinase